MLLWFFISVLCFVLIRIVRPMFSLKDNLHYNDLKDQFKPLNFFLNPLYGEGFLFFVSLIGSISFFLFSIAASFQINRTIDNMF